MDFLKDLFGDKAISFEDFKKAVEGSKTIKLANLADGGYVAKEKFDAKETEFKNVSTQLSDANKQIEAFKGMDVEGIKRAADEWKTKYETSKSEADKELNKLRMDNAVERALMAAKTKNPKLAKAALDMSLIKLDGETILGLNEQLEKLKESDGYLFEESKSGDDDPNKSSFRVNSSGEHKPGNNPDYDKMSDDEYYKTVMEAKK